MRFRAASKSPAASRSCSARTRAAGGCVETPHPIRWGEGVQRTGEGQLGKTGEALHLIGSCLFLANIALIGQIYNIVSRPPNAFLLWWIGIAALPWLLRSKAQHVLLLLAFGIWFGFEVNERGSWIYCESERQVLLYSLLGLAYLGAGYCLRMTKFFEFAGVTEKLGLLAFLTFVFPLTWKDFLRLGNRRNLTNGFSPRLSRSHFCCPRSGLKISVR